eukprot:6476446-Amphidinium_carterae.2
MILFAIHSTCTETPTSIWVFACMLKLEASERFMQLGHDAMTKLISATMPEMPARSLFVLMDCTVGVGNGLSAVAQVANGELQPKSFDARSLQHQLQQPQQQCTSNTSSNNTNV